MSVDSVLKGLRSLKYGVVDAFCTNLAFGPRGIFTMLELHTVLEARLDQHSELSKGTKGRRGSGRISARLFSANGPVVV